MMSQNQSQRQESKTGTRTRLAGGKCFVLGHMKRQWRVRMSLKGMTMSCEHGSGGYEALMLRHGCQG